MKARREEAAKEIQGVPEYTVGAGVRKGAGGYQFTLQVPAGEKASLVLYEKHGKEETRTLLPFEEGSRIGSLLSLSVKGLDAENTEYNYLLGDQIVKDVSARYLTGCESFGERTKEKEGIRCGMREQAYSWEDQGFAGCSLEESVLYKLQVRSFTKNKNSKVRDKGTFLGVVQKIPYFLDLGITGVLLMPAYEYQEIVSPKHRGIQNRRFQGEDRETGQVNCWGYTGDACYFAPKAAFAKGRDAVKEFKDMVNALHKAGIECLMEFYFDGSLAPGVMLDILRYWKCEYHIDGFHLMGEGICQEVFVKDAVLYGTKLFFQGIDGRALFHGVKPQRKCLAEYNDGFLYCMRRMLKGDENTAEEFLSRSKRNPEYSGVINYFADQNGFTMWDMVSYEERHNEANGENNQDGMEYNCSWNCGVEGVSRKQEVKRLRMKQIKNAFSMLLFSQGTPLIFQGDEWGNTQGGNNNAWCQDNEIGWLDWNGYKTRKQLYEFVKQGIAFRKAHGTLHMAAEPKNMDYKAFGYPDLSYHGAQAWQLNRESTLRSMGMCYCGDYGGEERKFLFIAYNFHWVSHEIALPGAAGEISWELVMRTDKEEDSFLLEPLPFTEKTVEVPPRTILLLIGKQEEKLCGSGNILRRLQGTSF